MDEEKENQLSAEYQAQMHLAAQAAPQSWFAAAFAFWLHKITIALVLGTWVTLMAFGAGWSHVIGIERDGIRHATGDVVRISHKITLPFQILPGYRLIMERDDGGKYITSELVKNTEAAGQMRESMNMQRKRLAQKAGIALQDWQLTEQHSDYSDATLDPLAGLGLGTFSGSGDAP